MNPTTTAAVAAGVVTWQAAQGWIIWALWGLVVLIGGILAFFIKRLVDKMDSTEKSNQELAVSLQGLSVSVKELRMQLSVIRELEISVARLEAIEEARVAKKNGGLVHRGTLIDE